MEAEDRRLIEQLQQGDPEASHRFVQDYYPGVFRYLLYLTRRHDMAEDLAQETFLQAWRRLDTFEGRSPLRLWLHRIAHREFLQALRSQRPQSSLEEVTEPCAPANEDWTDAIELRDAIGKLPDEERAVVVLHYLQGYSVEEVGQILRAHVSSIKYRLSAARSRLQRELGAGDLAYLNEPSVPMRQWGWLPLDQMYALEARLTLGGSGDRETRKEKPMERREFLRNAVAGTAGLMLPEKEIVDDRLTRKVTLAFKATALTDLCEHLRGETSIHLVAGPSVADEKVTLFCKKLPLREIMRQLSRPFGYTWLRSGTPGQYRYELVQDLRSQLLEEELRNRDRHAALLALEREVEQYRPYMDLSPDEALERAKTAPAAEKKLLEKLSGVGWGVMQMYFRLSPDELAALRAGHALIFDALKPGDTSEWVYWEKDALPPRVLPSNVARGVLQSWRDMRLPRLEDGFNLDRAVQPGNTEGLPLTAIPEARPMVLLRLSHTELGQFVIHGSTGFGTWGSEDRRADEGSFLSALPRRRPHDGSWLRSDGPYAVGQSPRILTPDNERANARLASDAALRPRLTLLPAPSCRPEETRHAADEEAVAGSEGAAPGARVTTADVLEALHRATGLPLVADFYTRLYPPGEVSVRDQPLYEALNQLGDTMRLRWQKEGNWLQFRSTSYYDDRLKEVPNRLLSRWSETRRQHGYLRVDDLVEIAQLSDTQLDGADMAEGARVCWGLAEWELARNGIIRPRLRYLAEFTPAQRQKAMSPAGLPFAKMSLVQQQGYLSHGLRAAAGPLTSLEDLAGAILRVDYRQHGWFEWRPPGPYWLQWFVPLAPGPQGQRALTPPVRGQTREAALQALRELDPTIREALRQAAIRFGGQEQETLTDSDAGQIVPVERDLVFVFMPGATNKIAPILYGLSMNVNPGTW